MFADKFHIDVAEAIRKGILEERMDFWTCTFCNTTMAGISSAKAHIRGTRHKREMQMSNIIGTAGGSFPHDTTDSPSNDVAAAIKRHEVLFEILSNQIQLKCVSCNVFCIGEVQMKHHLSSNAHAEKNKGKALNLWLSPKKVLPTFDILPSNKSPLQNNLVTSTDMMQDVADAIANGLVLRETLGNQIRLTCVPCNKPCTGEVPMSQHLISEAHAKQIERNNQSLRFSLDKEASATALTRNTNTTVQFDFTSPANTSPVQDVADAIKNGLVMRKILGHQILLTCVPCNKPCTGEVPMSQHLISEAHAKQIQRNNQNLRYPLGKEASATALTPKTNTTMQLDLTSHANAFLVQDVTDAIKSGLVLSETLGNKTLLTCVPCNKACSGEIPMRQHLTSGTHARQIQRNNQSLRFSLCKKASATTFTPSTNTTVQFYSPSLASASPVLEVSDAIESGLVLSETLGNQILLTCVLCNKACSGEIPMSQHLTSGTHAKQIQRNNQSMRLSLGKEASVIGLTPKTNTTMQLDLASSANASSVQDVANAVKSGLVLRETLGNQIRLTCVPCNIPCTGEVPMSQHLISETHAKQIERINQSLRFSLDKEASATALTPNTNTTEHLDSASPANTYLVQGVADAIESGLVLKEILGHQILLTCVPCNKQYTGGVPMSQHLISETHAKQIQRNNQSLKLCLGQEASATALAPKTNTTIQLDPTSPANASNVQDVADAIKSGLVLKETLNNQILLTCLPCNKSCSGEIPMRQHLTSRIHAKQIQRDNQSLKLSLDKEASATAFTLNTNTTMQVDSTSAANTYPVQEDEFSKAMDNGIVNAAEHGENHPMCLTYNMNCTKVYAVKEHLKDENHKKRSTSPLASSSSVNKTVQHSPTPPTSGTVPKNMTTTIDESAEFLEVGGENYIKKMGSDYECTLCKIPCNSKVQVKTHISGDAHIKQLWKMLLTSWELPVTATEIEGERSLSYLPLSAAAIQTETDIIPPPQQFLG